MELHIQSAHLIYDLSNFNKIFDISINNFKNYTNIIFVTCNWKVANIEVLNNSIKSKSPLLICSWHQRFL